MGKHKEIDDEPVFVDAAGRRRRVLAAIGAAAGLFAAIAIVTIAVGLIGGSNSALPTLPHKPRPASTAAQPGTTSSDSSPVPGTSPGPGQTPTLSTAPTAGTTPTSVTTGHSHPSNSHSPTVKPSHKN